MKYCFVLSSFLFFLTASQSSVYDIHLQSIDGNSINLSDYQGKKILITEFDAANPDTTQLQYLDSIQMASDSIVVLAVPATDFSGTTTNESLGNLRDSLGLHIQIAIPAAVKKTAGGEQHPLFRWLTDVNENSHFDNEVDQPDQLFVISTQGTLYSLLTKDTPHSVISTVLSQQNVE